MSFVFDGVRKICLSTFHAGVKTHADRLGDLFYRFIYALSAIYSVGSIVSVSMILK